MNSMNDIVLKNVSKRFGEKVVFDKFNHAFSKGSRVCIMGASGRGKTTLFNLLLGLIKPDSGEIIGVPKKLSAVFQEDRLCEEFTSVENVRAVTGKTVKNEEIVALLDELGLSGSENQPVSSLSGGMRRRVALARALLAENEMLILDEPFKGLDDKTREKTVLTLLSRAKGKTLLVATHDERDAELLDAEILVL